MFAFFLFVICITIGYAVGSISSAIIVCRICNLPDPRTEGSLNPGATNVMRLAGKSYGIVVLVADMLKGFLPVLLAQTLDAGSVTVGFTCLAAVIGHMFPVFFEYKGGKGVATAIGAMLGLHLILGVAVMLTWLVIAHFSRYSSLSSMIAIVLAPLYTLFIFGHVDAFIPLLLIAFLILYKHRSNINRLLDGTEPKLNFHKDKGILNMATDVETPKSSEDEEQEKKGPRS